MSDLSSLAATNATGSATSAATGAATSNPALKKAAAQFEAIFVRQMLASARKTHIDDKLFSSQGMDTFREQQDAHFADVAAARDSFGLGKMLEAKLSRQAGGTTPSTTTAKGG